MTSYTPSKGGAWPAVTNLKAPFGLRSMEQETSGVPVERTFYAIYDVRDRKVVCYRQYDTRA